MRKLFALILFFFLTLFFGETLLLSLVGMGAKVYFRLHKGWDFDFSSLTWEKGAFVCSDVYLEGAPFFSLEIPRVTVSLYQKHVEIERPELFIGQMPSFEGEGNFSWTCSIQEGIWGDARFSFEKRSIDEIGTVHLDWKGSKIVLKGTREGSTTWIDVKLHAFDLNVFPEWKGEINGSLLLSRDGALWIAHEGAIKGKNVKYLNSFAGLCGDLNWDLPIPIDLPSLKESPPFFDHGHLRLSLSQGTFFLPSGELGDLRGELSFDGSAGGKWDFFSSLHTKPLRFQGRAFFHSLQQCWFSADWSFPKGSCRLEGSEKEWGFHLDLFSQGVGPEEVLFAQEIASLLGAPSFLCTFEKGSFDGQFELQYRKGEGWDTKAIAFSVADLTLKNGGFLFSCREAKLKEDLVSFQDGSFSFPGSLSPIRGSGDLHLLTGQGHLLGGWGRVSFDCGLEKEGSSCKGHLQWKGVSEGSLSFRAKQEGSVVAFSILEGNGSLLPWGAIEQLEMTGEMSREGISCFNVRGSANLGKKISFFAPILQTEGVFDLRLEKDFLEVARFVGSSRSNEISFDLGKSHFFAVPISSIESSFSLEGLNRFAMECAIPGEIASLFFAIPSYFEKTCKIGLIDCSFLYEKEKGTHIDLAGRVCVKGESFDLQCALSGSQTNWKLDCLSFCDWVFEGDLEFGRRSIALYQGKGKLNDGGEIQFSAKCEAWDDWELDFRSLKIDLGKIPYFAEKSVRGVIEGSGLIHCKKGIESDFDLSFPEMSVGRFAFENRGPLHLYLSSKDGLFMRGINGLFTDRDKSLSLADCKMGLLQYQFDEKRFVFTHSQIYLMEEFDERELLCSLFQKEGQIPYEDLFQKIALFKPLLCIVDLSCSSDFSILSCSIKELVVPFEGVPYHLHNLRLDVDPKEWKMSFDLEHLSQWIPMDLNVVFRPSLCGSLVIENGMKIDWSYQNGWKIHSIEGKCAGLEASFHLDSDALIGSFRFNCHRLKELVPLAIAEVFQDLKMGDGYELMGKVSTGEKGLAFQGILSGKEIELFGFEFRNLIAQVDLASNHVFITDVKVSDIAGVMKIDRIIAKEEPGSPWTLSIPRLTISELRPSLLHKVGSPPGEMTPLLVRHLEINNLEGLLEESRTYKGTGELYFLNSYRREKSILEVPSDLLSRIVGLDLDLLIPVCGTLHYELRDGAFHFTKLEGAYSENHRSEFFLSFDEISPTLDLDWNLHLLITMKQFVLFKFTESFIISVSGKLDEPKFQLQRKKRFLGVL